MMTEDDFEELLSLACAAYEKKGGIAPVFSTKVSYETGSNGRGWR